MKTAFAQLQTAASGLTTSNLKEKAPAIATSLAQVAAATKALSATLAEACPGVDEISGRAAVKHVEDHESTVRSCDG